MSAVEHIAGETFHGRRGGPKNAFRYGIDYVLIDAENRQKAPGLFKRNKRGLLSLWDRDHGGMPKQGTGAAWVRDVLGAHSIDLKGPILLLAQPRVLGHVFNPVSFWLCHALDGSLRVVVAEVSNTFGDRHSYICAHEDLRPITRDEVLTAKKIFHVSPFQPIRGDYTFRFDITEDQILIHIDYKEGEGGLIATLKGSRAPLTNRGILAACLRRPLGSRRVLALIHWQALKLWWKGARYRPRPEPPQTDVS